MRPWTSDATVKVDGTNGWKKPSSSKEHPVKNTKTTTTSTHIQTGAIEVGSHFSNCYIQDRFPPDKAIDCWMKRGSGDEPDLKLCGSKRSTSALDWKENLKAQATREEDLWKSSLPLIQQVKYKEMQGQHVTDQETPVISEKWLNTSLNKRPIFLLVIWKKEQSQLINLASDLKACVIGQDDAVDKIAKAIFDVLPRISNRPIEASSLSGPNGTGKTELSNNWRSSLWLLQTIWSALIASEYMKT